jgi:hypothetical protein
MNIVYLILSHLQHVFNVFVAACHSLVSIDFASSTIFTKNRMWIQADRFLTVDDDNTSKTQPHAFMQLLWWFPNVLYIVTRIVPPLQICFHGRHIAISYEHATHGVRTGVITLMQMVIKNLTCRNNCYFTHPVTSVFNCFVDTLNNISQILGLTIDLNKWLPPVWVSNCKLAGKGETIDWFDVRSAVMNAGRYLLIEGAFEALCCCWPVWYTTVVLWCPDVLWLSLCPWSVKGIDSVINVGSISVIHAALLFDGLLLMLPFVVNNLHKSKRRG